MGTSKNRFLHNKSEKKKKADLSYILCPKGNILKYSF